MKTWVCPLCHARPMPYDVLVVARKPRWSVVVRCTDCGAKMCLAKKGILWLLDKHGHRMTLPGEVERKTNDRVPF